MPNEIDRTQVTIETTIDNSQALKKINETEQELEKLENPREIDLNINIDNILDNIWSEAQNYLKEFDKSYNRGKPNREAYEMGYKPLMDVYQKVLSQRDTITLNGLQGLLTDIGFKLDGETITQIGNEGAKVDNSTIIEAIEGFGNDVGGLSAAISEYNKEINATTSKSAREGKTEEELQQIYQRLIDIKSAIEAKYNVQLPQGPNGYKFVGNQQFNAILLQFMEQLQQQMQQQGNQGQQSQGGGNNGDKDNNLQMGKLFGALFGIRSLFSLVRRIVSQNEGLMTAINNFFTTVRNILAPILNFLGAFINTIAGWLGKIFGVSSETATNTGNTARTLMGFDEINRLDAPNSGGGAATKQPGKLQWLEDLLNGLLETIKGIIKLVAGLIRAAFMSIVVIVETVIAAIATLIGGAVRTVWGLINGLFNGAGALIGGLIKTIWGLFDDLRNMFINIFKNFIEGYKKAREEGHGIFMSLLLGIWESLKGLWNDTIKLISDLFTNLRDTAVNTWKVFLENFKRGFDTIFDWFKDKILNPIAQTIADTYNKVLKPILDWVGTALSQVLSGLKWLVNGVVGMINSVIGVLNKIPGVSLGYLPTFAKGGFPENGQLFLANEAGPELVGKMGNQNAVANSQQIIEGIKQGVLEAMRESSGETNVYIDGDKLFSFVTNRNNSTVMRTGKSPLLV